MSKQVSLSVSLNISGSALLQENCAISKHFAEQHPAVVRSILVKMARRVSGGVPRTADIQKALAKTAGKDKRRRK